MTNNYLESGKDGIPKRFNSLNEVKLLEEFPDTRPLIITDLHGDIVYSNQAFEKIFNYKKGDDFTGFNSEPSLINVVEGLAKSNYSSFHFELFIPSANDYADLFYNTEVERIYIGETEFFILVFSSLEEKRKLENKINNLHNALEYGNIPVIITDKEGAITYTTKSFEQILERRIEDLYKKPISEVMVKFLAKDEITELKQKMKKSEPCSKLISDIDSEGIVWYKEIKVTPVVREGSESQNFIITANDISDYIHKTRIIKKSEERQKSIINNISDLLLIIRAKRKDFIFENANDNFYEVFLVDRVKTAGKNINEVLDRPFRLSITENINKLNDSGNDSIEFRYKNILVKREYLGSISFTDDHYENERIYIISLKDITEQQLNEEKLRKAYERETHINKMKSSFLANMYHEIRTPLNAMIGYTELIEDDVKSGNNESAMELFTYLKEGYSRFMNLIENIVELTLIQSGEAEIEMTRVEVNKSIKNIQKEFANISAFKNQRFVLNLTPDLFITADAKKFEKILSMLVDNSVKYTDAYGSVLISSVQESGKVKITISDTGRGIKQSELQRVFEPFSQEDEGHKREYEGAGLGLTIAYNLTKIMKGEFDVISAKDQGTNITLTFTAN